MATPPPRTSIAAMMRPESVAVIGASPDLTRYPGKILNTLQRYKFPGRVYAVTPTHREVLGYQCYSHVSEVPEPVDVALILVGARNTLAALRDAIAAGCRTAIIFSSGFGEIGGEGIQLQLAMADIARKNAVRILGPNCLGCLNIRRSAMLTGSAALQREDLLLGHLGIATQSGGIMSTLMDRAWTAGVGISSVISTGNEADVDLADCVEYFVDDEDTKAISLFVESIRDVGRFSVACERAMARQKPIFVLKSGRTESGRRAALGHTAALAGNDRAYGALFERLGVVRVKELDDLFLATNVVINSTAPEGSRVALLASSGGMSSILADLCGDFNIPLAKLEPETLAQIQEFLTGFGTADNPLDMTGAVVAQDKRWQARRICELLLADPNVDILLYASGTSQFAEITAQLLSSVSVAAKKPVLVSWSGSDAIAPALKHLREAKVPVFDQPAVCIRILDAASRFWRFQKDHQERPSPLSPKIDLTRQAAALRLLAGPSPALAEHDSKQLLALYGIQSSKEQVVSSADAAMAAARTIGLPVAVKAHGADLLHKSERNGVMLDLRSAQDVAEAFRRVTSSAQTAEALVAAMIEPGPELILGLSRDPQIGLLLVVGTGGIFVEILRDSAIALCPLKPGEADRLLSGLQAAPLLKGARGRPASDRASIIAAIEGLSQLAVEIGDHIEQIDVNPLIAGRRALAADALVIKRVTASSTEPAHDPKSVMKGART